MEQIKISVFVALKWFWEGDSELVNSYQGLYQTLEEAVRANENKITWDVKGVKPDCNMMKIYLPGEIDAEKQQGSYGTPSFIQIIKEELPLR